MSAQLSFDGVDMLDDEDEDLFDDDFVRQKMKRRSKCDDDIEGAFTMVKRLSSSEIDTQPRIKPTHSTEMVLESPEREVSKQTRQTMFDMLDVMAEAKEEDEDDKRWTRTAIVNDDLLKEVESLAQP